MTAGKAREGAARMPGTPNRVLRGIREKERHETRAEFAEAMARVAREIGEEVYPDAKYVERLESGVIFWPRPPYRNILARLCGRPIGELGFSAPILSLPAGASDPGDSSAADVNIVLRDAILASGMEITELARKVGVNPKSVQRWITNGRIPHARHRWKACQILGHAESELWPDPIPDKKGPEIGPSATTADTSRCTEIPAPVRWDQAGADDVIDVLGRIERLGRAVDPEIISHLQGNLHHTVAQYERLEHSSLIPVLLKQRAWIDGLLAQCSHPKQRQQLYKIAGATSGVLGYVAVGRGDFPLARAYCLEAFQLGDFAEDVILQAWARGLQSFCEYYAGRYDEALLFAQDGLNYARSGPQSVRLAINGVARSMGKLGNVEGVHRAVAEAYDLMSRNDVPSGVPSSIAFECYSAAQTASNAATAYVSLGMTEKVQYYVDLALPEISRSESPWSRSLVMIDLALSLVRSNEGDLDRAAALMLDAIRISAGRPIISVRQRTSEFLQGAAGRWGPVRQVERVADAASTAKVF